MRIHVKNPVGRTPMLSGAVRFGRIEKGVVQLTPNEFDKQVLRARKPVMVNFSAPWCKPCQAFTPTVQQIAAECKKMLKVAQVDVEAYPELAKRFGITRVPTLVFFQKGKALSDFVGLRPKGEVVEQIETWVPKTKGVSGTED